VRELSEKMRAFHEVANRQQISSWHGKPLVKETLGNVLVRASAALPILAAIPKVRNPPKSSTPKGSAIASHLAASSCLGFAGSPQLPVEVQRTSHRSRLFLLPLSLWLVC